MDLLLLLLLMYWIIINVGFRTFKSIYMWNWFNVVSVYFTALLYFPFWVLGLCFSLIIYFHFHFHLSYLLLYSFSGCRFFNHWIGPLVGWAKRHQVWYIKHHQISGICEKVVLLKGEVCIKSISLHVIDIKSWELLPNGVFLDM